MITSEKIKDYIEIELNNLAIELGYDIVFQGESIPFTYDWIKEKYGMPLTPFLLSTERFYKTNESDITIDFKYTIVALAFNDDVVSGDFERLYATLMGRLKSAYIDDFNVSFTPLTYQIGDEFSEGSGFGRTRRQALLSFEGKATNSYGLAQTILTFGSLNIPVNSYKYEHAKINYLNKDDFDNANNKNINANLMVIETLLSANNNALTNLLNSGQKVNIKKELVLTIGDISIINDNYSFESYSLHYDKERNKNVAFLYFIQYKEIGLIRIGGEEIPIIDYGFATTIETDPHNSPDDNIARSMYLGRARAYSFIVAEADGFALKEKFNQELLSDLDQKPLYILEIELDNELYEKRVIIKDISKEGANGFSGLFSITFLDGSDL